jgi:prepilin-type N-terminal cleavage/methylation domain-containing protein
MQLALARLLVTLATSTATPCDLGRLRAAAPRTPSHRLRARGRGGARGFTIPELLAVVIIIGVFSALASPRFIDAMIDRRVNSAAMEVSGIFRLARTRALGRGTAVMVRWAPDPLNGGRMHFEMREALLDSVAGSIITKSCLNVVNWQDPGETVRVTAFTPLVERAVVSFVDQGGAARTSAEVCFTSRGRTFVRYDGAPGFTQLLGVARVNVTNSRTNLLRTVFIPPNGVSRLAL